VLNFHGFKKAGRDYTYTLPSILPNIIGEKAKSIAEIASEAGRSDDAAGRAITHCRQDVHIESWRRTKVGWVPLYLWGRGEDAAKPPPLTSAEKSRIYRASEHGRIASAAACHAYQLSPAGAEYRKRRYQKIKQARDRKRQAHAMLKEIDPLLAAFIR